MLDRLAAQGWDTIPVLDGDRVVAHLATKGTEVHLITTDARGWLSRKKIMAYLEPLRETHGFLTTRVTPPEQHELRWLERLGFKRTWSDDQYIYLMLSQTPLLR